MIEVVIDTNVIVSAIRSRFGASWRLLQTLESRRWRPIVSPTLVLEYEAVLKRGIGDAGALGFEDIDDFVEYFCSRSRLVQIYFNWRPVLPDPDDDRILEVAVRTGASIVTFNRKDFRGSEGFGIRTMTPAEFLEVVER